MNQINLGPDAGIDTDEVQYWFVVPGVTLKESTLTRVQFKNGKEAILRGDAKTAFDEWKAGDSTSCQTCKVFDDDEERCTWTIGHVSFPKCYEAKEGEEERALANGERLRCNTCGSWQEQNSHYCSRGYMISAYPGCHTDEVQARLRKRRLATPPCGPCIDYNVETNLCDRVDMSKSLPECFRERVRGQGEDVGA